MERIFSFRSIFFPLRVDPILEGLFLPESKSCHGLLLFVHGCTPFYGDTGKHSRLTIRSSPVMKLCSLINFVYQIKDYPCLF